MIWCENFLSPIGSIIVAADERGLTTLTFGEYENENPSEITNAAVKQLDEYFKGERKTFDLPLSPKGTDFQKKVWSELLKIPYGEVCSYKDIAEKIRKPNASRAVGNANGKNPLAIIVPCHRVIASDGKLGGYSLGLDKKEFLLTMEAKFK